jgi:hypothetical protein
MVKYKYPHFNPGVHKIESKIATVRAGHHCKFNINYHIIWIPKYRKKEFELAEKINVGDSIKAIGDKNISVVFCDRLEKLHKPVKYDEKQSKLMVQ